MLEVQTLFFSPGIWVVCSRPLKNDEQAVQHYYLKNDRQAVEHYQRTADAGMLSMTRHFNLALCEVRQILQVSTCMPGIVFVVVDHLLAHCQSQELHIAYTQEDFLHPIRAQVRIQIIRYNLFLEWN